VELYLNSPNTPSWRGVQLKKAQGLHLLHLPVHLKLDNKLTQTQLNNTEMAQGMTQRRK
jgi:hypothetical protein